MDLQGITRTIDTDVLVIGGGGAACRAAVAAHDGGARTIVALKGQLGTSGATVAAGHGVAWQAADECAGPDDSPEVHHRNIIDVGLGMADERLARILAYEILDRMEELEGWGLQFAPDPTGKKRHLSAYSCFGDQPRAHCIWNSGHGHAGDIVVALRRQMAQRDIPVHENVLITDLLVVDGVCRGALAVGPDGDVIAYRAGAVVLGTGGARRVFRRHGRPAIDTTGDGYAMAVRAGAEVANMEFMQFMLGVFIHSPMSVPGPIWSLVPTVRNRYGEDFLPRYLPEGVTAEDAMRARCLHVPFSCRDASGWLDIAVTTEIREGRGTDEGGILVDFSRVDLRRFRPPRHTTLFGMGDEQVVLPEGPVQVRNHAHAINGGVRINTRAAATLPGLFAAGETAAGPHGADRLGGGMVTNCQVFGARAGRFAAEHALSSGRPEFAPQALEAPLRRLRSYGRGKHPTAAVWDALQEATDRDLVVARDREGLQRLAERLAELRAEMLPRVAAPTAAALRDALEVDNALLTTQLIVYVALRREESRGSHYRIDFPRRDDARWGQSILLRLEGDRIVERMATLSTLDE